MYASFACTDFEKYIVGNLSVVVNILEFKNFIRLLSNIKLIFRNILWFETIDCILR